MDYVRLRDEWRGMPTDNLNRVHDAYLRTYEMGPRARRGVGAEAMRWAEFALAQAVYKAQLRGEVTSQNHFDGVPVVMYLPPRSQLSKYCAEIMRYSPDQYAEAIEGARRKGTLSQRQISLELRAMIPVLPSIKEVGVQVKPTKRGERLINNLALTLNSLASSCDGVSVDEVDGEALREVVLQARADMGAVRGFLQRVKV